MTTPDQPTDPNREQPGAGGTGEGYGSAWDQPGAGSGSAGYGGVDPYPAPPPSAAPDPYAAQPYGQQPYGAPDPYAAQQPYGAAGPYAGQQPYGQQQPYGGAPAPYAGQQPGYGSAPYVAVYGHYPRNSLGVWSLVLGIVSFVLFCLGPFTGIAAIITGAFGRKAAQRGEANNGGLALAGIILGGLVCAGWVVFVALGLAGVWDEPVGFDYGYSTY